MKFAVGNTYSPGRRAGARNRLSTAFLTDLAEAWERDGKNALRVMAKEDPSRFVTAVASLSCRGSWRFRTTPLAN